ncbi:glyoxylase-like metal-dependent hydrolase (beta-lactamase superfamily II) [Pseudonocardia hierapolitana]|uniref:Glyoxylase-like metal-dependent hydrolase (Beta-lactamase superfamily II) n=1 Tax=Pseudonocardia hierapolitana TaxID=1128676 RepID=A0A561T295_9PSEU|nr:MBL fold metallo-hydrolase [Pseudonocardia hierapolitana]TWF81234.1 glyoxylase-like metal-dependent hydrolase (beta-lactamase superfamily II) [Pseudonocardia hierapolitana]
MAPPPAVAVAPGVFRIPTVGSWAVNSFALVDGDGSVTLVDTGVERAPARIVAGLAALGKHPADVQRIVLTHAHPDHAGGAKEMADRTGAPLAVHADDAGFVESGESPPNDKSYSVGRVFARLQDGRFPAVGVGEKLTDGQVLDVAGGLRVVATPGHSPGHISLLHQPTRTLITGDAIFNVLGMRYPPRFFCTDFRMTKRTAHVLGELEYDRVAFTHGPEIVGGARDAVRRFLAKSLTA